MAPTNSSGTGIDGKHQSADETREESISAVVTNAMAHGFGVSVFPPTGKRHGWVTLHAEEEMGQGVTYTVQIFRFCSMSK